MVHLALRNTLRRNTGACREVPVVLRGEAYRRCMSAREGDERISLTFSKTALRDSTRAGGGSRHMVTRIVHALRRTLADGVNPVTCLACDLTALGGFRGEALPSVALDAACITTKAYFHSPLPAGLPLA